MHIINHNIWLNKNTTYLNEIRKDGIQIYYFDFADNDYVDYINNKKNTKNTHKEKYGE